MQPLKLTTHMLRRVDVFKELSHQVLADMLTEAVGVRRNKDDTIVTYGGATQQVYFLITGCVRVEIRRGNGRAITFDVLRAGSTVEEMSAIDGFPRSVTVRAEEYVALARLSYRSLAFAAGTTSEFRPTDPATRYQSLPPSR